MVSVRQEHPQGTCPRVARLQGGGPPQQGQTLGATGPVRDWRCCKEGDPDTPLSTPFSPSKAILDI